VVCFVRLGGPHVTCPFCLLIEWAEMLESPRMTFIGGLGQGGRT